jgi:gamma-glutamyltranspeptidase/glutathione hydrolase
MHGVIAAGGPETVAAALEMFALGGNAVDAAVAATFASFIGEIGVVHLGGSGMAQVYDPRYGRSVVYDFFSNTPGLGTPVRDPDAMDFDQVTIDFGATTQNFHLGRASVAVPGNIFGLWRMAQDYARLPWETLLQPAIALAQNGVSLQPFQADTCRLLAPLYTNTPSMRAIFWQNGRMIEPGERVVVPHLAATLQALAAQGEAYARTGRLAQALLADQMAEGGLLTPADLVQFQVNKLSAIRLPYRDYEILLPPPSSTGGVLTAFSMKVLSAFPVGSLQHGSAPHLRLLYEVLAATSRARPVWEKFSLKMAVPEAIGRFLDDEFVAGYVGEIRDALAGRHRSTSVEEPGPSNTSHLSTIDSDGLSVSLTTTAAMLFQIRGTSPTTSWAKKTFIPRVFTSALPASALPQ